MSTRTKHIIGVAIAIASTVAGVLFGPGGPLVKTGISATVVVALLADVKAALGAQS
jgi:hypothetical protein